MFITNSSTIRLDSLRDTTYILLHSIARSARTKPRHSPNKQINAHSPIFLPTHLPASLSHALFHTRRLETIMNSIFFTFLMFFCMTITIAKPASLSHNHLHRRTKPNSRYLYASGGTDACPMDYSLCVQQCQELHPANTTRYLAARCSQNSESFMSLRWG